MGRLIRMAGDDLREYPEYIELKTRCLNGELGFIGAIKAIRGFLGCDLLGAKQEVEKWYAEVGPFNAKVCRLVLTAIDRADLEFTFPNPFYKNKVFKGVVKNPLNNSANFSAPSLASQLIIETGWEGRTINWDSVRENFRIQVERWVNEKQYEWGNMELVNAVSSMKTTSPSLRLSLPIFSIGWIITPNRNEYVKKGLSKEAFKATGHFVWKQKKLELTIVQKPDGFFVDVTLPKIYGGGFIKQETCDFNEINPTINKLVELGKGFIDHIEVMQDIKPNLGNMTLEIERRLSDLSQLLGADAYYLGKADGFNIYKCKNLKFKWTRGKSNTHAFEIVSYPNLFLNDFKDIIHINRLKKGEKK